MSYLKKYPIKKVYVFSKRLNCAKNAEFEKYKSNAIAFAWFIWEVGYTGITLYRNYATKMDLIKNSIKTIKNRI